MDYYIQEGQVLRFTEVPIQVYLRPVEGEQWPLALDEAVKELSQVLPIEATTNWLEADIIIRVLPAAQFAYMTPCDALHTDGCGVILPMGEPNSPHFRVMGRVWLIAEPTLPLEHLLLHELIHALGLLVHSPYPEDVMYNGQAAAPIHLSERDQATLAYLYSLPAW